jgi:carboxypeptidase Taq
MTIDNPSNFLNVLPMTAYESLCRIARERALLSSTAAALDWDQETNMPAAGVDFRSQQLGYLAGKIHALGTSAEFRAHLESTEAAAAHTPEAAANLREWRHHFDRATLLPRELVEEDTRLSAVAKHAWADARSRSDFATFAPFLQQLVDLARRKADLWGYQDEPYDALLGAYERGAKTADIAALFDPIRGELAEIAAAAVARGTAIPGDLLDGDYPVAQQQLLNRRIAEAIGFDFDAGRIDTTTHPFCTGLGPRDTRLTTRYDPRDFTSSLFGVLHEAGHGLYDQGLPAEKYGLPSGEAVSLGIHESQSRLWENHVGRSRPFWEKWLPVAADLFPHLRAIDLETFLGAINRAAYSFIRVEADEATYDLHILLRFSIERQLLNGSLAIAELPAAWNAEFTTLFGMTPPDDARGCLQDIHWSMGGIGYFTTYTLGNLNSAQLFAAACSNTEVAAAANNADYAPLLAWMRRSVHAHGSTMLPQDLMASATGSPTTAAPYLAHLRHRFLGGY